MGKVQIRIFNPPFVSIIHEGKKKARKTGKKKGNGVLVDPVDKWFGVLVKAHLRINLQDRKKENRRKKKKGKDRGAHCLPSILDKGGKGDKKKKKICCQRPRHLSAINRRNPLLAAYVRRGR